MTFLLLETATPVCSVALWHEGASVASCHSEAVNAHSSLLPGFISSLFSTSGLSMQSLDAVCVSSGPGSYTGLRIGVSTAKGICYALGIPLLAVPTLEGMAALYFLQHPDYQGLVCPMIDARRMECYTAIFSREGQLRDTEAEVVQQGLYDTWLDKGPLAFIGDGAEKTRPLMQSHPNALYDTAFCVDAVGMGAKAEMLLSRGEVQDVAYFEPFYLKDFVAKKSVVHGLRDGV